MKLASKNGLWKLNEASFKNVIHLNEFKFPDLNGRNATITGPNGSGKTLITDLISATLDPKSSKREAIVGENGPMATAKLELIRQEEGKTSVMRVSRSFAKDESGKDKAKTPTVEIDGVKQKRPGSLLSSLINAYSLNLTAIAEDPNSLRDLILGKFPLKLDQKKLNEKYEIDLSGYNVPHEIWDQHALIAIDELVNGESNAPGHLYSIRTNINDEKRRYQKSAEQIEEEIPVDFDPDKAEKLSVSDVSKKLAEAERKNERIDELSGVKEELLSQFEELKADRVSIKLKIGELKDDLGDAKNIKVHIEQAMEVVNDTSFASVRSNIQSINTELAEIISDRKHKIEKAKENQESISNKVDDTKEKGKRVAAELKTLEKVDTSGLKEEMAKYDETKSMLHQWKQMQKYKAQAEELAADSRELTAIIDRLRSDVLMDMIKTIDAPVQIKDGKLCVKNEHDNIVPIEHLSDAQKVLHYIDILVTIEEGFGCIVVEEGRADFDEEHKKLFDNKISELEETGYQIIKAKSSGGELRVEQ